jgi:hypothetical protein
LNLPVHSGLILGSISCQKLQANGSSAPFALSTDQIFQLFAIVADDEFHPIGLTTANLTAQFVPAGMTDIHQPLAYVCLALSRHQHLPNTESLSPSIS